jgi:hypothetical protein
MERSCLALGRVVRENQLYHVVWRWEAGEGKLLGGEMVVDEE